MTGDYVKKFRHLINQRDFEGVESLWLELVGSESSIEPFREVFELLVKEGLRDQATTLLSILVSERKDSKDIGGALDGLKLLATLNPNERYLRRQMAELYQELHRDNPRINEYLNRSELTGHRPVDEAVSFLENCLKFQPGVRVLDSDQGVGQVLELDLLLDRLVVDFGQDRRTTFHIAAAFRHLVPLSSDHILSRKLDDLAGLQELARTDPLQLLKIELRSFGRPLRLREIKEHLRGIVAEANWETFWVRVTRLANSDPEICVNTRPERSYEWRFGVPSRPGKRDARENGADAESSARRPVRKGRSPGHASVRVGTSLFPDAELSQDTHGLSPGGSSAVFDLATSSQIDKSEPVASELGTGKVQEPAESGPGPVGSRSTMGQEATVDSGRAVLERSAEEQATCTRDLREKADFIRSIGAASSLDELKAVLNQARETLPDWADVFRATFLGTKDKRVWFLVLKELTADARALGELLKEVTTSFAKYPAQFLYLVANLARLGIHLDARDVASRCIDLLASDQHRAYWGEAKARIAEDDHILLRAAVQALDGREARQWLQGIGRAVGLESYQVDEIRRVFYSLHPELEESEAVAEEVVYSTREGIERREQELRRLLETELPKSSAEIGRAREFGDLSENYEYKAAKERQVRLLAQIGQLQRDLKA
ncbi:MAG: hypothetical protein ABIK62_05710, partial [candidate division WOR-3 bacterium]